MVRSLLLVGVLCLSACTPTTIPSTTVPQPTTPETSTTTTTLGPAESVTAFAACLEQEGTAVGVPLVGDVDADLIAIAATLDTTDPSVRAAVVSCSSLLTVAQARQLTVDPEVRALVAEQLQSFAACMRGEGVEGFPDPLDGSVPGFDPEAIPFDDTDFDPALATCSDLIGSYGLDG